ncbi:MAG TPA: HD domain-containing protein [Candidatus Dormibacteraeota bacterium]|nr:HD domain-containing protein [Candidatus Dormibacteraeota bacterium]
MKPHYVSDLADGQMITSLYLVREKEIRTSARTGKSWLELSLSDRSGSIPAKMWDNFEAIVKTFERDDVVRVRARVKLYNERKELTLEQIVPAAEKDYELADFLPHTKYDVEKLYAELRAAIAGMKNPWLQKLLACIVDDPEIAPRLKRAPAAMTMHHAYIGGLLEHTVSLLGLANALCAHYPELDRDLLLAGVVLHDIGKIEELRYARGIEYSDEGRLLGHISMGAMLVREKCKVIEHFPAPLLVMVQHLILSHHGSLEFGSPSLPQFPEAIALHAIDDLDSKMAGMRATIELSSGAGTAQMWTDRNPSLRRSLLRGKEFLAAAEKVAQPNGANGAASPVQPPVAKKV